ncbi:plant intracellular Ras-group-related LRR protein 6-like [Nylanderia fulva]|uniref:plant intracellular Ras-group-related LRR protein 6-like n=1 Tax=Nylanderia fulva TaxID=613905 RepID=UPI0010FBB0F8|nr:plant intracellular Ras-group-related LRR protein 6-like [Nylanderia fulva]
MLVPNVQAILKDILKDMRIFLFNGFLLLGFVVATVPDVLVLGSSKCAETMDQNPLPNTCCYNRVNSVLEARCSQLYEIPLDLNPDIQVLNITKSKILRLSNASLRSYKKLAFIYLPENIIRLIEETAFANQLYLEVLDLSQNLCYTLPKSLFQLPHFRTLYLGNNRLTDLVFEMKVTSPLRLLELSENLLTVIPNIGIQPTLLNLNVSYNRITSISTEDLAPYCSLKELDLTGNRIRFNASSCDCQRFNAWVKLRQIKIKPDLYKCIDPPAALNKDCAKVKFSYWTYELFNECLAMIQQKMEPETPRSVWINVAPCVLVFLFVVFVALFCLHKRYRRRHMEQDEQLTVIYDNTKPSNSNLTMISEII